jgi:hypothetical protein
MIRVEFEFGDGNELTSEDELSNAIGDENGFDFWKELRREKEVDVVHC